VTGGSLRREALLAAVAAAVVASALAWLGPPGSDLAAHVYQRTVFLHHGFALWNNFWYAGRYSFVSYSLLYYPLAAVLGIRLLAVATIATAAYAFAVVLLREWGPTARWSSRTFAVVWAGIVLSAAFPFALGTAFALLALWALQARAHWRFALLALLTLAASPVAFVLLAIVAGGSALAGRNLSRHLVPAVALVVIGVAELLLWRAFPGGGRYPFSPAEMAAAAAFCILGLYSTWGVDSLRVPRYVFALYLAACIVSYLVPSALGENIARFRYVALPLAVLVWSVRKWKPLVPALVVLGLALSWNLSPLVASYTHGESDPAAKASYWTGAQRFLLRNLTPDYRVEAVDTVGHWPAVYLARVNIPLARGWFRQDDFPQNALLYSKLGPGAYTAWLRSLGVRYVVLTNAPTDYSARGEAALLRGGRSPLVPVLHTNTTTIYRVPDARPILTGPGSPHVLALNEAQVVLRLTAPGRYRLAIRWSPYWKASSGCLTQRRDGMIGLVAKRAAAINLTFDVNASRALAAVTGAKPDCDSS
jgi:hypothetical protein